MADSSFYDKLREQIALAIHKQDCMNVTWQGDDCKGEISHTQYGTADAVLNIVWSDIEGLQQDLETSRARSKHLKELIEQIDIAAKEKWNCGNCGKECDGYCHECARQSLEND